MLWMRIESVRWMKRQADICWRYQIRLLFASKRKKGTNNPKATSLDAMTLTQLRQESKNKNRLVSGKKVDWIERLREVNTAEEVFEPEDDMELESAITLTEANNPRPAERQTRDNCSNS